MKNRWLLWAVSVLTLTPLMLAGCAKEPEPGSSGASRESQPIPVVIGVTAAEDALPLWVAEEQGLFAAHGLDSVEIVTFESAEERDTALLAGEIDAFAADIVTAARLEAAATPVTIATVMLGSVPAEGRFGIVAAPDSGYADLTALTGVPVGTSVGTLEEYVLDGLMRQAEVPPASVLPEIVAKPSVRYDLLMRGQLKAALLPEPWLSLAEHGDATVLADDTTGENLSQTTLVFSDEYLSEIGGVDTMSAILKAWNDAVRVINEEPDAWRDMLVRKAGLPGALKESYRMSSYPEAKIPTSAQIDAVLEWLADKGITEKNVLTYEDLVLVLP